MAAPSPAKLPPLQDHPRALPPELPGSPLPATTCAERSRPSLAPLAVAAAAAAPAPAASGAESPFPKLPRITAPRPAEKPGNLEEEGRAYFERTGVRQLFETFVERMYLERMDNPLQFMLDYLKETPVIKP
eukprot:m.19193 g.19193  ORF g.19193 m.19193 type:complete len:131 (-) comp10323_c0_seq1:44-436(-)